MTPNQTDERDPLIGVLGSMRRAELLVLVAIVLSQTWLFYAMNSESQRAESDRRVRDQQHQEMMESLNAARASVTQSIQLQLRNGRFEELREKLDAN